MSFNRRWAVLIGVGRYPKASGIAPLNFPASDIEKMKQMLLQYGGFSAENVIELLDDKATYRRINQTFQRLETQIGPEDLLVVYFSGRGSRVLATPAAPVVIGWSILRVAQALLRLQGAGPLGERLNPAIRERLKSGQREGSF